MLVFEQILIKSCVKMTLTNQHMICPINLKQINVLFSVCFFNNIITLEEYYLSFNHQSFYWVFQAPSKARSKQRDTEMKNKQNLFKNLGCVTFCLFTFFIASIFVSETYYNRIINDQIQDSSLLKSSHFQQWGQMQEPSSVIHKFTPYIYDDKDEASLYNGSIKYQYSFEYKNYSFTQGNTGNIRYLNTWKKQSISNSDAISAQKIKVFNVDAESVYNYDYYAPAVRQFTLAYNVLYDSLKREFLPVFYATYIFEYLYKNASMVYSRVFKPLGMSEQKASAIYTHQTYGMSTPALLSKWLQLSQHIDDSSFYISHFYQGLISELKLTKEQILYVAGPGSSLQAMFVASKNLLKYKLAKLDDDLCGDEFCTDEQLMAAQLGVGFLTKQSLFVSTSIDKNINQLNTTLLNTIQYSAFCESRPDLEPCSGDDNTGAISFFLVNQFSNYAAVEFILNNLDNYDSLESFCNLPNEGEALSEYVKFLYSNTFNLHKVNGVNIDAKKSQTTSTNDSKRQQPQSLSLQQQQSSNINVEAFKRSFTNYNHLQSILGNFQSILYVQLHTRAFYNKFIDQDKKKCEEYYVGDFQQYKGDCAKLPMESIGDVRVYVNAYLGNDAGRFVEATTMQSEILGEFLHNEGKSLLAQHLNKLSTDISAQYNCQSHTCSPEQLFHSEWLTGTILTHLPTTYFPKTPTVSITQWDEQKKLKNVQPQLYKYITVSADIQPAAILNSHSTGIYSLFNLMKVYNDKDGSLYQGIVNADLLHYVHSLVMDVEFEGVHLQLTMEEFLNSHYSPIVNKKRTIDPQMGGAPWLNPYVSVLKLTNQPQKFNYINSGIYNQQKLRAISQIQDNIFSSSTYQVYKSEDDDVTVTFTSQNKVGGTNLFGFQTKIQQNDNINGYFDMIYRPQTMAFKQTTEWKGANGESIDAYKFQIEDTKQFSVSVQELANRTVQLSKDTYFIVEPNTGLTLEYYIKYTVLSKPFYTEYDKSKNSTHGYQLYQGEMYFVNDNTQKIVQISDDQHMLKVLLLLGIIFSSLSFISCVVMIFLYRKARKVNKFSDQNKSLMSSENSSL